MGPSYQNNRNSGRSMRWLFALGILIFGYFMYMNQVEENPVTGKRQHVSITPAEEVHLGLQSAPEMANQMGGEVSANDPRLKVVQQVGALLVSKMDISKSPWKFKFHLLADAKTINAFALPGGQVFITLGLYNKLTTEAELAGVLGHEIGHVLERHTAQQMAKSQLGQYFVVAVGTATSDSGFSQSNPAMIAAVVNQMFQLRYSRVDESDADVWGLKLLEKANFDPRSMVTVMKILKAASNGKGSSHIPEMFQTHPNPDLRIEQIEEYLKKNPPGANVTEGQPLKSMEAAISSSSRINLPYSVLGIIECYVCRL